MPAYPLINRNPAPMSPRCDFQWRYAMQYAPSILNVGCSSDPLQFWGAAHHFDYDDWSKYHRRFTQGDAHTVDIVMGERSFDLVIMGDIHEHLVDPLKATLAAARVARNVLCMTIFEEWRLPGVGQWLTEANAQAIKDNEALGFRNPEHYNQVHFPERVTGGDAPHLSHINQFSDEDIARLTQEVCSQEGFEVAFYVKAPEAVYEGHQWYNWLVALQRVEADNAWQTSEELETVSCVTA